jgi:dephospho-CoA kinase
MAQQISRKDRLQKADDVIINNRDIDFLKVQVIQLHHRYLVLSKDGNQTAN